MEAMNYNSRRVCSNCQQELTDRKLFPEQFEIVRVESYHRHIEGSYCSLECLALHNSEPLITYVNWLHDDIFAPKSQNWMDTEP